MNSNEIIGPPTGLWERLVAWLVEYRFLAWTLGALVIFAGIAFAPFDLRVPGLARDPVPVDAIPDIGENQQIVFTEWPGRSARDVDDQVTYPLTTALLGLPGVRTIRSSSAVGFSSIYVIFEDDIDFYWARSRILEKLAALPPNLLPPGTAPALGPDATALGQVFWYTLEGRAPDGRVVGGFDLHELRSIQDWVVRYALQSVPGVAEVASIGGHVLEYQVDIDPDALRANDIDLDQVVAAVRSANLDIGARTLEINGVEYIIRGLGFLRSIADLERTVVAERDFATIRLGDIAHVGTGPRLRTGTLDDAGAPAVGGVVVARHLANPMEVITAVKLRMDELQASLPTRTLDDGTVAQVRIVPFYDRTELIGEVLDTLSTSLLREVLLTIIVVIVLLRSLRSAFLVSSMLPMGVLLTFVLMKQASVDANIMALGGIAIAIGTMVDIGIVFIESMDEGIARAPRDANRVWVIARAGGEVAPAILTSVMTTMVGFLPVFGLTESELRLFAPLAWTKTFAMGGALFLGIAMLPGMAFVVLRPHPEKLQLQQIPAAARLRAIARSLLRPAHLRDYVLVGLGILLLDIHIGAAALVVAMGLWRLLRPLVAPRTERWFTALELAAVAIAVTLLLSNRWSPLGPGAGELGNLLFVAVLLGGVLAIFILFEITYPRLLRWFLIHRWVFISMPVSMLVLALVIWLGFPRVFGWLPDSLLQSGTGQALSRNFPGLGREYMPPFDEGSFLVMPMTMSHASVGEVIAMLSATDAAIAAIPEVDRVVGKAGRAESALDPAPLAMIETLVTFRPEYRIEADGTPVRQWRDHIRTPEDIWDEIAKAATYPGLSGAPVLMPISARMVMLQSGMRSALGIKVQGPDLGSIETFGLALAEILKEVEVLRPETVFAERVVGKPHLELEIDRDAIGRYGITIDAVQMILDIALGGAELTRTVEGRERYGVRVRYAREERDSVEAIGRILVPTPRGEQIPLSQLARVVYTRGPEMIRAEDTFTTSFVLFDRDADVPEVDAVEKARAHIETRIADGTLKIPTGVSWRFAGTWENHVRSEERLRVLIPIALLLIVSILYVQFKRISTTLLIFAGVAVAASGGFLLLWLYAQPWFLDFSIAGIAMRDLFQVDTVNLSVAVWIGFIALVGVATDDGVVMASLLDHRFRAEPPTDRETIIARTVEAGTRRVRACLMTTATTVLALLPVVTSHGRGSDVMMPMALPSLGGMTIELMTLFTVPVLYAWIEMVRLAARRPRPGRPGPPASEIGREQPHESVADTPRE
jgi:Cu(I)/Ag(I) efflux system membrane protein CusA/SilA